MSLYPVNEIFGPTIQGEGMYIGAKTIFIRFAGCDSRCDWCDTKYAWNAQNATQMTSEEILTACEKLTGGKAFPLVTLTGGNPLIHDLGTEVLSRLRHLFKEIHVETQATVIKPWIEQVDFVSISPKREYLDIHVLNDMVGLMRGICQLKVVIFSEADIEFAKMLRGIYGDIPMTLQLGYTAGKEYPNGEHLRLIDLLLADSDFGEDIRILPQVHRTLWKDKKGV